MRLLQAVDEMGTPFSAKYGTKEWGRQQAVIAGLAEKGRVLKYTIRAVRYDGPPRITAANLVRKTGWFSRKNLLYTDTVENAEWVLSYIRNNRATSERGKDQRPMLRITTVG